MYCKHCGKQIEDGSAFCPFCGNRVTNTHPDDTESLNSNKHQKNKTPKRWPGILAIVVILTAIVLLVIDFFGGNYLVRFISNVTKSDTTLNREDVLFEPAPENMSFDSTEGVIYYNNLITVYLSKELNSSDITKLEAMVSGKAVGRISGCINVLQMQVDPSELNELNDKCDTLMSSEDVLFATYSFPIEIDGSTLWDGDEDLGNEHKPDGADWWAEAIGAYTAWDFMDYASQSIVGVMDSGFDLDHEDLVDSNGDPIITMINTNSENDHGTHVAGLIGAQDNDDGMRGVVDNVKLICADWSQDNAGGNGSTSLLYPEAILLNYKKMISYAEQQGSSHIVINNSWGAGDYTSNLLLSISEKDAKTAYTKELEASARSAIAMIEQLILYAKTDFIIVQSAGNGYKEDIFFDGDDLGIGHDTSSSAFFSGITEDLFNQFAGITHSKAFSYEDIKNHIVIVSAATISSDDSYELTSFSNYGDTVDIVAPGQDIYSTIPNDDYDYKSGTSMAAPIVSGAAALVWSLNDELTSKDVKAILINTSSSRAVGVTGKDKGRYYPFLDIGSAVLNVSTGSITCTLLDSDTDKPIESVSCSISSDVSERFNLDYPIYSDSDGQIFVSSLGTTTLSFNAEGYSPYTLDIEVGLREEIDLGSVLLEPIITEDNTGQERNNISRQLLQVIIYSSFSSTPTTSDYTWNDQDQIICEEVDTGYLQYDYTYEYDVQGRLISKAAGVGIQNRGDEWIKRSYDSGGNLLTEGSQLIGDYFAMRTFTYSADGILETEHREMEYAGDSDYVYTYEEYSDGTYAYTRHQTDNSTADAVFIYESNGRLIQGLEEYWLVPTTLTYTSDPLFLIVSESYAMPDWTDGIPDSTSTYALLLDSIGKEVDRIPLGSNPTLEYDDAGYLIKASTDQGYVEFIYDNAAEEGEKKDTAGDAIVINANKTPQKIDITHWGGYVSECSLVYNDQGLLISVIDEGSLSASFTYDEQGYLIRSENQLVSGMPAVNLHEYQYTNGRLSSMKVGGFSGRIGDKQDYQDLLPIEFIYEYDADGDLLAISEGESKADVICDTEGRILRAEYNDGHAVDYTYQDAFPFLIVTEETSGGYMLSPAPETYLCILGGSEERQDILQLAGETMILSEAPKVEFNDNGYVSSIVTYEEYGDHETRYDFIYE